ncbi:MAG: LPS export ABC transporter ATP-binding protein [Holosporales bacterium]|jgi:lipopolysaccharide export system ATP-binding protein|nr:LPS export ABC transporter ATP-binding protein [Holosporales bacterium]
MIFEVKNLSKSYKHKVILKGINLLFNTGEIVGILGPNGAGKTTLFSILIGILSATSGRILLSGENITNLKIHQRARAGLVYLPQDSSVFRGLTVEDNIKAVLQITYSSKKEIETKLDELLEIFSIAHLRKAKVSILSGGERRKVEIARALATSPAFFMLDEPFSGIDPISINDIIQIIKMLKESDIGIIITDHNIRETLTAIDRGYVITNGKVLISGTPNEIINDDNVKKQYTGHMFSHSARNAN